MPNFELIAVDDSSSDGSYEILAIRRCRTIHRIRVLRSPGKGHRRRPELSQSLSRAVVISRAWMLMT
jgi:glycosyltransferase involved in cell wall biosynthesis